MLAKDVKGLGLTFPPMKPMRFAVEADLEGENEVVVGRVIHFDRHSGAQTFDRNHECGVLVLDCPDWPDAWMKIALDKPNLADGVYWALVAARDLGIEEPWLTIRYLGCGKKGWKEYKVRPAKEMRGGEDG